MRPALLMLSLPVPPLPKWHIHSFEALQGLSSFAVYWFYLTQRGEYVRELMSNFCRSVHFFLPLILMFRLILSVELLFDATQPGLMNKQDLIHGRVRHLS